MAHLESILEKLGWNDGFQVPLANAENQALEKELAKLSLQKLKTKTALDNTKSRLADLKDHFKYVTQENEQTQKLLTAHKQQYDSEQQQFFAFKGERNKLKHDITEANKRMSFLDERKNLLKQELQKAVIKVDRVKQETGWDIEALKAWEEALKKRDDDNELIKKFSKEDDRRFNELEARRQLLQVEYDSKVASINKLVCDLHSCEMIIDRTGKSIKQQMDSREALIKQWKDSVNMLQQRDADISQGQKAIAEQHAVLEMQQDRLNEQNEMLDNEKRNNHAVEMEIENLNNTNSRLRRELNEWINKKNGIMSECHTVKRLMALSAKNLEKMRMDNKIFDQTMDENERKYIKNQEDIENLKTKVSDMAGNTLSSAGRISKLQKIIDQEEKHCEILKSDINKINGDLYRADQLLIDYQSTAKELEMSINNSQCMCYKLKKHIEDKRKALEKLKEVVYDMQFKIDEFEQRLCKMEGGDKDDERNDEKEEKIKEIEKSLADHNEVAHTLQNQVNRLQDEMRKLWNIITADKTQHEILKSKVENHLLVYEIGRKQIANAKKSTQEKQVEENIMRLRINHIEKDMQKEENKIFNLQKLRLTLDQVMKERNLEIDTKKIIVLTKKRNLDEEKGRLSGDISRRKLRLEQYQKKYHIELMSLGRDKDGQPLTITTLRIMNAQEKFMLQEQGDQLDQKIKVAEREIVAMENTLKVINLTNVAFKNNLSPLKEGDKDVEETKILEMEHRKWVAKTRKVREELEICSSQLDELQTTLHDELKPVLKERKTRLREFEEENISIINQKKAKIEKLRRTEAQVKKQMKKIKPNLIELYDNDLKIRQLKDCNGQAIKKLQTMLSECPDIMPHITKYSTEYDINLESFSSLTSICLSSGASSLDSKMSTDRDTNAVREGTPIMVNKVEISFN